MLGPDYIEHFTDAAQGAMDEYTLRLVCIYAALIGSIDFEGDSAYSQAARKAAERDARAGGKGKSPDHGGDVRQPGIDKEG